MATQDTKKLGRLVVLWILLTAVCGVSITPAIDSVILAPRDRITNLRQLRHLVCLPQASCKRKLETPWRAESDVRVRLDTPKSSSGRVRQGPGSLYITISPQTRPPRNIRDVLAKESAATRALDMPPTIRVQFVSGLLDAHIPVDYYTGTLDNDFDPLDRVEGLVSFDLIQDSSASAGYMQSPIDRDNELDDFRTIVVKKAYPAYQVPLYSLCGSLDGTMPSPKQIFPCFTFRLRRIPEDTSFKILFENESSGRPVQVTYQVYWLKEPFPVLITESAPVAVRLSSYEQSPRAARISSPQQQDIRNQDLSRTHSMRFPRKYPMPISDEWNGLSESTRELFRSDIADNTSPDRADFSSNAGSHAFDSNAGSRGFDSTAESHAFDSHSDDHNERPRSLIFYSDIDKGKAPALEVSNLLNSEETSRQSRPSSRYLPRFDRSLSDTPSNLQLATDSLLGSRRVEIESGPSHVAGNDEQDFSAVRYPAIAAYPLPELPTKQFFPLPQLYSAESFGNTKPQIAPPARGATTVAAPMAPESELESPGRGRKLTLRQALLLKGASDDSW